MNPFLPRKTLENLRFSDVINEYKKGKFVWNELKQIKAKVWQRY